MSPVLLKGFVTVDVKSKDSSLKTFRDVLFAPGHLYEILLSQLFQ